MKTNYLEKDPIKIKNDFNRQKKFLKYVLEQMDLKEYTTSIQEKHMTLSFKDLKIKDEDVFYNFYFKSGYYRRIIKNIKRNHRYPWSSTEAMYQLNKKQILEYGRTVRILIPGDMEKQLLNTLPLILHYRSKNK